MQQTGWISAVAAASRCFAPGRIVPEPAIGPGLRIVRESAAIVAVTVLVLIAAIERTLRIAPRAAVVVRALRIAPRAAAIARLPPTAPARQHPAAVVAMP